MVPVDAVQAKIIALEKGIASTNEALINAKETLRLLEKETSHLISENKDKYVIGRGLNDTVTAKLKLETISNAMGEANINLEALKTERTSLQQDRATTLRDVIANSYGPVQAQFLSYLERAHKLFIVWGLLGETLAQDFDIKYGKKAVLDDKIQPLSFAQYASDLKYFIGAAADFEQTHLGTKQFTKTAK